MRRMLPLLLLLTVEAMHAASPPPIALYRLTPEQVDETAHAVPPTNPERFARLERAFDDADCRDQDFQVQAVASSKLKNLVCTMQGNTGEEIVIGAHYELEGKGAAAVDDWSGAIMLPMIYKALRATVPNHTFVFVEFAGRDGARDYMDHLTKKQRKAILGMVGLEALGIGTVQFWGNPNNGQLLLDREAALGKILGDAADLVGENLDHPPMERVWGSLKVDDTEQFHNVNIPAVMIHSVHLNNRNLPGSERDTISAIDTTFYYQAYELLSTYCVQLDRTLEDRFSLKQIGPGAHEDASALVPRAQPNFPVDARPWHPR